MHARLKRQVQPAFTSKALLEQEPIQQLHLGKLISNMESLADNEVIDISNYLASTVWDIAGDLSFGEPLLESNRRKYTVHLRYGILW